MSACSGCSTMAGTWWSAANAWSVRPRRGSCRIETAQRDGVHLEVVSEDCHEACLYCFSEEPAAKECGIVERFARRFETASAHCPTDFDRAPFKRVFQVWERIGRLKAKNRPLPALRIELDTDPIAERSNRGALHPTPGRRLRSMTHPGVVPAQLKPIETMETLWRTYVLTDLEAVFRSLKSELTATHLPPQAHPRRRSFSSPVIGLPARVQLIR